MKAMRPQLLVEDAADRQAIEVMESAYAASERCAAAVRKRFRNQLPATQPQDEEMAETMRSLDAAEITIDGDEASMVREGFVLKAKRRGDQWLISPGQYLRELSRAIGADFAHLTRITTRATNEVADDLERGKYSTLDEVGEAFQAACAKRAFDP